ncbi:hypothetical protein BD626DRAFT_587313 [Schizophyllum amplum]|uniref:MYND-type domain-containing protein n=1 Tax=Schizophyllum amplum TaxID=97359 RepID=A0A550BVE0_9AGAR|nr:hypothetical protein BD626DRAFT_587313 [Auriculariopsis ampla]
MRESNFCFPAQNKASVCISSQLYDRRALDTSSPLPLFNSLTHLTYLTSTSPRIREIMTMDGGLERLVKILHDFCLAPPSPENPVLFYGLMPKPAKGRASPEREYVLNPATFDKHAAFRFSLAFQCLVNIGVRGSENIRSRVVQAGTLDVVGCILEAWLVNRGFGLVGPPAGIPSRTTTTSSRAGAGTSRAPASRAPGSAPRPGAPPAIPTAAGTPLMPRIPAANVPPSRPRAVIPPPFTRQNASWLYTDQDPPAPPTPTAPAAPFYRDRSQTIVARPRMPETRDSSPEQPARRQQPVDVRPLSADARAAVASTSETMRRPGDQRRSASEAQRRPTLDRVGTSNSSASFSTDNTSPSSSRPQSPHQHSPSSSRPETETEDDEEPVLGGGSVLGGGPGSMLGGGVTRGREEPLMSAMARSRTVTRPERLGQDGMGRDDIGTLNEMGLEGNQLGLERTALDEDQLNTIAMGDGDPAHQIGLADPHIGGEPGIAGGHQLGHLHIGLSDDLDGAMLNDDFAMGAPPGAPGALVTRPGVRLPTSGPLSTDVSGSEDEGPSMRHSPPLHLHPQQQASTSRTLLQQIEATPRAGSVPLPDDEYISRPGNRSSFAGAASFSGANYGFGNVTFGTGGAAFAPSSAGGFQSASTSANAELGRQAESSSAGPSVSEDQHAMPSLRTGFASYSGAGPSMYVDVSADGVSSTTDLVTGRTTAADEDVEMESPVRPAAPLPVSREVSVPIIAHPRPTRPSPQAAPPTPQAPQISQGASLSPQQAAQGSPTQPPAPNPSPYTDSDVLLALQLLAYLSKYPHVRQAFYKVREGFHPASATYVAQQQAQQINITLSGQPIASASGGGSSKGKSKSKAADAVSSFISGPSSGKASSSKASGSTAASSTTRIRQTNVFALVERFTWRPSSSQIAAAAAAAAANAEATGTIGSSSSSGTAQPPAAGPGVPAAAATATSPPRRFVPPTPQLPPEIQYWAGVIMRNACRKDESRGGIRQCANMLCGKWESYPREFAKCRRCRKAKYCGKECQSTAWSEGHRFWCSAKEGDDERADRRASEAQAASGADADGDGASTGTVRRHHRHHDREGRERDRERDRSAIATLTGLGFLTGGGGGGGGGGTRTATRNRPGIFTRAGLPSFGQAQQQQQQPPPQEPLTQGQVPYAVYQSYATRQQQERLRAETVTAAPRAAEQERRENEALLMQYGILEERVREMTAEELAEVAGRLRRETEGGEDVNMG